MLLMFDNPVLHVVDYPAQDAVEVIDKRLGRGLFMRDEAAQRFRDELRIFVSGDPDVDACGDFLDGYDEFLNQPSIYH